MLTNLRTHVLPRPAELHRDGSLVLASGFLATLAMTTIMYILPMVGLGQVDLPIWAARLWIGDAVTVGAAALGIHLLLGFGYAWLFAEQVEPRLSLRPMWAGLTFGLSLWFLAQAVAVPLLGTLASAMDPSVQSPGVLAWHLGIGAASASLLAHLAYGFTLGVVYGCHGGGSCR